MSDLSELIQIAKNIEKQNEEIIRLLKKVAGEEEKPSAEEEIPSLDEISRIILKDIDRVYEPKPVEEEVTFNLPPRVSENFLLENSHDVGEVYFIEEDDIFKLTIKNNETSIDNLTGDDESTSFALQEIIANE